MSIRRLLSATSPALHLFPEGEGGTPAAGAGTPPTGGGGTPPTGGGEDTGIKLTRAEYDALTQKAKAAEELPKLKKNWESAQALLSPNPNADRGQLMDHTRHVLTEAGYSTDQVQKYLDENYPDPATQPPKGRGKTTPAAGEKEGEGEEEQPSEMEQVREQVATLKKGQDQERYLRLKGMLEGEVEGQLDIRSELGTLVDKLVKANTDGVEDAVKVNEYRRDLTEQFRADIELETRRLLSARQNQSRDWRDSWIQEEARKAAATVLARSKRLIPDVSRLVKAPAGDSLEQYMAENKPLNPPAYKPGMKVGDIQKDLREYAVDKLLRAGSQNGTTAV